LIDKFFERDDCAAIDRLRFCGSSFLRKNVPELGHGSRKRAMLRRRDRSASTRSPFRSSSPPRPACVTYRTSASTISLREQCLANSQTLTNEGSASWTRRRSSRMLPRSNRPHNI